MVSKILKLLSFIVFLFLNQGNYNVLQVVSQTVKVGRSRFQLLFSVRGVALEHSNSKGAGFYHEFTSSADFSPQFHAYTLGVGQGVV